jgi:hypothetical protein
MKHTDKELLEIIDQFVIENLLKDDWFEEEDYTGMLNDLYDYRIQMVRDLKEGIHLGYTVEYQLNIAKTLITNGNKNLSDR